MCVHLPPELILRLLGKDYMCIYNILKFDPDPSKILEIMIQRRKSRGSNKLLGSGLHSLSAFLVLNM